MNKVKEEMVLSSKSYCKIGKITAKKNIVNGSDLVPFDFKTEAFKKSTLRFIERIRTL